MSNQRQAYPSDVTEDEWAFCAPYLTLMREDAEQRTHPLRESFNSMRYVVRTGCQWRYLPHDFPPRTAGYQQARRWWMARCFETMVHDLRGMLRVVAGQLPDPTAAVVDSRTVSSTPESGTRAGYDGHKRRKGSKIHIAVDALGHLLALRVTSASEQDRAQVAAVAKATREATDQSVEIAYVDHGHTGDTAAEAAQSRGIQLDVVELPQAKRGFVLPPRRWVVERSFGWLSRFRPLARGYEGLANSLEAKQWLAFLGLVFGAASRINLK